ncbi:hypothetical protein KIPB_000748 [Kipferlia bialata]|uniref:Uncharacterized protein n=1 Tax=Kipferlia bialata TaxID=797122 RepID=A0A9K3GDN8_9EUKA|nr:hypothetical protein KIPB_000748 [Kipferlia bialata]|eukprot:g748.t1
MPLPHTHQGQSKLGNQFQVCMCIPYKCCMVPVSIMFHPTDRDCLVACISSGEVYSVNTCTHVWTLVHKASHPVSQMISGVYVDENIIQLCLISNEASQTVISLATDSHTPLQCIVLKVPFEDDGFLPCFGGSFDPTDR